MKNDLNLVASAARPNLIVTPIWRPNFTIRFTAEYPTAERTITEPAIGTSIMPEGFLTQTGLMTRADD